MDRKKSILFWTFLKIGLFTIGGGLAMLPIIAEELCDKKKWISKEEMTDIIGVVQSLPGVIATNTAAFVGLKVAGTMGALVSVIASIIPSFVIILIIAMVFPAFSHNTYVVKAFDGITAGLAALITVNAFKFAKETLKDAFSIILAIASFILAYILNFNLILVILVGAVAALIYYSIRKAKKHADNI